MNYLPSDAGFLFINMIAGTIWRLKSSQLIVGLGFWNTFANDMKGELRLETDLRWGLFLDPQEILRIDFAIRSRMCRNSSTTWSFRSGFFFKIVYPNELGRWSNSMARISFTWLGVFYCRNVLYSRLVVRLGIARFSVKEIFTWRKFRIQKPHPKNH